MDLVLSSSSMILRRSSTSRLLSCTIPASRARHFSYTLQLSLPAENSTSSRPGQSKSKPVDPLERRKASDREQWIKDLNEAIPSWSAPRPVVSQRLKFGGDGGANAFGVNLGTKERTEQTTNTSRPEDFNENNISSIAGNNTSPLPTRNISIFEAKTSVQAFAEKANAMDYDLNLSPRVAYRIPVSSGGSSETELTRSLKVLSARTIQNRVPMRMNRQKFHERPGLKRKRLKKERWRKHFADAFRTICARVGRLSRQGW